MVWGSVVDDDHSKVGVLLLHDGLDVPAVSEIYVVFEGRTNNTSVYFVGVAIDMIFFFIIKALSQIELFECRVLFKVLACKLLIL